MMGIAHVFFTFNPENKPLNFINVIKIGNQKLGET